MTRHHPAIEGSSDVPQPRFQSLHGRMGFLSNITSRAIDMPCAISECALTHIRAYQSEAQSEERVFPKQETLVFLARLAVRDAEATKASSYGSLESMKRDLSALAAVAALVSGCATNIHPTVTTNPPPTRALSTFGMFEVKPLTVDDSVEEPDAVAKIQEVCGEKLGTLVSGWSRGKGDTLVIEPRIQELKFVSGANRVLAGAMAGSSAVRITAKLSDKSSGAIIAEPEFYQRAAAWSGSFTYGAQDNDMLKRICMVAEDYLRRNYVQAVGGPTGSEAK